MLPHLPFTLRSCHSHTNFISTSPLNVFPSRFNHFVALCYWMLSTTVFIHTQLLVTVTRKLQEMYMPPTVHS